MYDIPKLESEETTVVAVRRYQSSYSNPVIGIVIHNSQEILLDVDTSDPDQANFEIRSGDSVVLMRGGGGINDFRRAVFYTNREKRTGAMTFVVWQPELDNVRIITDEDIKRHGL